MSATEQSVKVRSDHRAWVAGFGQILDGNYRCDTCGAEAVVSLNAEPDYQATPMCWEHGRAMVQVALDIGDRLWLSTVKKSL